MVISGGRVGRRRLTMSNPGTGDHRVGCWSEANFEAGTARLGAACLKVCAGGGAAHAHPSGAAPGGRECFRVDDRAPIPRRCSWRTVPGYIGASRMIAWMITGEQGRHDLRNPVNSPALVCPEHERKAYVGTLSGCGAAREMKVMALRSRPAGGGFKPPHAALAEDRRGER